MASSFNNSTSKIETLEKSGSASTDNRDRILNSTLNGESTSPEKFKRFLHERNDDMERLGISFDEDSNFIDSIDDGYLEESDEDNEKERLRYKKKATKKKKKFDASDTGNSIWERITFLL